MEGAEEMKVNNRKQLTEHKMGAGTSRVQSFDGGRTVISVLYCACYVLL